MVAELHLETVLWQGWFVCTVHLGKACRPMLTGTCLVQQVAITVAAANEATMAQSKGHLRVI
jgi:hypothetical protein